MDGRGQLRELARALLHPRAAWTTAWRGDPRPGWWVAFRIGLLAMTFASAGAFVGLTGLLGRAVETSPGGVPAMVLTLLATLCLASACQYFVLIWVAFVGWAMRP